MFCIQSKNEIDVNALRLLGASVKDEGAIGEFGSGWKYALACFMRNSITIRVFSGLNEIKITAQPSTFRDQQFDVIHINGEPTSITTRTGPKWTPKMAIREIWSNALDEGEAKKGYGLSPMPGITTVMLEITSDVQDVLDNWDALFIAQEEKPLFADDRYAIYPRHGYQFYRKGVWICEEQDKETIFSYDFGDAVKLPESRLVSSYHCRSLIGYILTNCNEFSVWRTIFAAGGIRNVELESIYDTFLFSAPNAMRTAFLENYTHIGKNERKDTYNELITGQYKVFWCDSKSYSALKNIFPNIEEQFDLNDVYKIVPWMPENKKTLNEALSLLSRNLIIFPDDVTFHYVVGVDGKDIIALADINKKRCCLGVTAFRNKNMLLKALVEEWTHLRHKVHDGTREQQHVYLDTIVSLLTCKQ